MPFTPLHDTLDDSLSGTEGEPSAGYILYAEDNASDAAFFARCLRRVDPDLKLIHRENGMLARDFLESRIAENLPLPRVVILDIKMPGRSGLDVLEYIRSTDGLKHVPVLMLSASSEKRDLRRAVRQRASAYLTKPERYHNLKDLVEAIVHFWMQLNQAPK